MALERVECKRVTISAAGVEGYLPFMRADGEATLKTLADYREIINTLIVRHDFPVSQGFLLSGGTLLAKSKLGTASIATEQRCLVDTADQRTGRTRCWQH
jgi:hypothetical protein